MKFIILLTLLLPVIYANLSCDKIRTVYQQSNCCTGGDTQCLKELPDCTDAGVVFGQICTDTNGNAFVKGLQDAFDFSHVNDSPAYITFKKSLIPDANAAYDIGNAEKKLRYLFKSDT